MELISAQKGRCRSDRRLSLRAANCMPAGRFFFFNMTGGLLGGSLRLRCLHSGRRNLRDFRNVECDLVGPIYRGGICTLNFHSTIRPRHLAPSCGGHAPTGERTLNPARTFLESLDPRPGIREQPGRVEDGRGYATSGRTRPTRPSPNRSVSRAAASPISRKPDYSCPCRELDPAIMVERFGM
jgi:hypothetical protein